MNNFFHYPGFFGRKICLGRKRRIALWQTIFLSGAIFLFLPRSTFANSLTISNVTLEDRDATLGTAIVEFDISWSNSWRDTTNHDAVWIFVKATKNSGPYQHGMMLQSGVNPPGTSPGSNKSLEIYVPTDKTGAFIRRKSSSAGQTGNVSSKDVRLKLSYTASPLSAVQGDKLVAKVFGIEMVYVPAYPFRAGDGSAYAVANVVGILRKGPTGTLSPWYIESESTISTTVSGAQTYYYNSAGVSGEDTSGAIFDLPDSAASTLTSPASFPKGYEPFYAMKYEVTEGMWVDFINTLTAEAQSNRDITSAANGGKSSDAVVYRNTVSFTGNASTVPGTALTARPDRAMSYLSWMDLCAFLDWAALRPMTELEYEKICRGPTIDVAGEYAWGSTAITAAVTMSVSPETGLEAISDSPTPNANYNNTTSLAGGDAYLGSGYTQGPLRAGIFATSSSTRVTSGAGYYGAMEMTGNLSERVITIGNATGRAFLGSHGDGILVTTTTSPIYAGNAIQSLWPGSDATNGVSVALGSGFKGGDWSITTAGSISVSNRYRAALRDDNRNQTYGGRGVRSCDVSGCTDCCP